MNTLSSKAQHLLDSINNGSQKLGDLRKMAKDLKKDHELSMELWQSKQYLPRMLAVLIMDVKKLDTQTIDGLFSDMLEHPVSEQQQLADWLMANQLTKEKRTIALMNSWRNDAAALKRRLFWYYEGRLRWMGKTEHDNTSELLAALEREMLSEAPEVQWAMNFTAGWIGIFDVQHREKCVEMGQTFGLYKDDFVPRNCTPNYLPKFIEIEAGKRGL